MSSWLMRLLRGVKLLPVLARIKEEAPQVVPLLEALEANDYDLAANVVLSYGDVQEAQRLLATEVAEAIDKAVAALPAEAQEAAKALLVEQLSPEVQEKLLRLILSIGLRKVDDLIPEETILRAMAIVGLT